MRFIVLFLLLFIPYFARCENLKDFLKKADKGDYIIAKQNKLISALIIHDISKDMIVLEEISIPENKLDNKNYKNWLENAALQNTSWTFYEININDNELIECFSLTKNAWLNFYENEFLFTKLFTLELTKENNNWSPPKIFEGKKENIKLDHYITIWPNDSSIFSSKKIDIYFDSNNFSFPYWINIQNEKKPIIRVVDSGKNLKLYKFTIPKRPIEFSGPLLLTKNGIQIKVKTPKYYSNFSLYALDITKHEKELISFGFNITYRNSEIMIIEIPLKELNSKLNNKGKYIWMMSTSEKNSFITETKSPFVWNPKIIKTK